MITCCRNLTSFQSGHTILQMKSGKGNFSTNYWCDLLKGHIFFFQLGPIKKKYCPGYRISMDTRIQFVLSVYKIGKMTKKLITIRFKDELWMMSCEVASGLVVFIFNLTFFLLLNQK